MISTVTVSITLLNILIVVGIAAGIVYIWRHRR